MNNSFVLEQKHEEKIDVSPLYRSRQEELVKLLEALEKLTASNYWKLVQQGIFQEELKLAQDTLKREKDTVELYRVQGKIEILEKYADLTKRIAFIKNELTRITTNLKNNGKEEK